jgi:hypothetical protein
MVRLGSWAFRGGGGPCTSSWGAAHGAIKRQAARRAPAPHLPQRQAARRAHLLLRVEVGDQLRAPVAAALAGRLEVQAAGHQLVRQVGARVEVGEVERRREGRGRGRGRGRRGGRRRRGWRRRGARRVCVCRAQWGRARRQHTWLLFGLVGLSTSAVPCAARRRAAGRRGDIHQQRANVRGAEHVRGLAWRDVDRAVASGAGPRAPLDGVLASHVLVVGGAEPSGEGAGKACRAGGVAAAVAFPVAVPRAAVHVDLQAVLFPPLSCAPAVPSHVRVVIAVVLRGRPYGDGRLLPGDAGEGLRDAEWAPAPAAVCVAVQAVALVMLRAGDERLPPVVVVCDGEVVLHADLQRAAVRAGWRRKTAAPLLYSDSLPARLARNQMVAQGVRPLLRCWPTPSRPWSRAQPLIQDRLAAPAPCGSRASTRSPPGRRRRQYGRCRLRRWRRCGT